MAKSTRFATTVTTRNLVTESGFDGFYLDGRISGPRDSRMGETTLDREDRGFFYAIYTNTGNDIKQVAYKNKKHLDKILEDMKQENKYNIDHEINELADCAVNIAGRLHLGQGASPYFSGLIVKDGEMAAITAGRACAYLYRNDVLYPLTNDDFPISDYDLKGNKVPNIDLYCAGLAGTIRYSNIAQLQPDDCFVLCNREVMETIGQMGMLKLLEDAYDQQDAACRVYDMMAEKNPTATVQFMIGFVEGLNTLDKAALKSLTGRVNWTQKTLNGIGGLSSLSDVTSGYQGQATAQSNVGYTGVNAQASQDSYMPNQIPQPQTSTSHAIPPTNEGPAYTANTSMTTAPSEAPENLNETKVFSQGTAYTPLNAQVPNNEQIAQAHTTAVPIIGYADGRRLGQNNKQNRMLEETENSGVSTTQKIIISILLIVMFALIVTIGVVAYNLLFAKTNTSASTTNTDSTNPNAPTLVIPSENTTDTNKKSDETSSTSTSGTKDSGKTQVVPRDEKDTSEDSSSTSGTKDENSTPTTPSEPTTGNDNESAQDNKTPNNNGATNSSPSNPTSNTAAPKTYTVQAGDTLWSIGVNNANGRDIDAYLEELVKANPTTLPNGLNSFLEVGMELIIP